MRHIKILLKTRVLVVLLALASPTAGFGAELTTVAPSPLAGLSFSKILNHQTASGSDIILQAAALPANPDLGVYALTRVGTAANGALAAVGLAIKNPVQINNNAPPANPGGDAYVSPLFGRFPAKALVFGDYVAATVRTRTLDNLILVPTVNPQAVISTAYNPALVGAGGNVNPGGPGAGNPPTITFTPLHDAAGNNSSKIAALAASKDAVFAAVGEGAAEFTAGGDNRGIAKVALTNNVLVQAPFNGANAAVQAAQLSLAAQNDAAVGNIVGAVFNNVGVGAIAGNFATVNLGRNLPGVVMHYDDTLNRLFVGLKGLAKNVVRNPGGLVGVLVGEPDAVNPTHINLRSIFHAPTRDLLDGVGGADQNRHDRVLGIYHDAARGAVAVAAGDNRVAQGQNAFVSIHQLKTMHTSTGRSYLIVASEIGAFSQAVANTQRSSGLYFVPIMGKKNSAGQTASATQIGKVANADGTAILGGGAGVPAVRDISVEELGAAQSLLELPLAGLNCITNTVEILDNAESRVRTVQLLAARGDNDIAYISDLQVLGDSVLVSVAGANANNAKFRGVYQSTAIFNAAGDIVSWTPLQRVSGVTENAKAVSMDNVTGAVMSLNGLGNTFHLADWITNRAATTELQQLIAKHFPVSQGGVRAVHSFDGSTPTFRGGLIDNTVVNAIRLKALQQDQRCSLLVVLGYDKVMVVQTAFNNRTADHFRDTNAGGLPTFQGAGNNIQNVFVFDKTNSPDLGKIAPLTCAEVLKIVRDGATSTEGNIYIGGYNGVCRLEPAGVPLDGYGWTLRTAGGQRGLLNFGAEVFAPAPPANALTFKKLANPALKDVRRIVSTIGTVGGAPADGSRVVAVLGDGYMVAQGDQFDFVPVVKVPMPDSGQIFDGVLVKNIAAPIPVPPAVGGFGAHAPADQSRLILATEKGLVVHPLNGGADQTVPLAGGDLPIQLAYMPRSRGGVTGGGAAALNGGGMLYVLAGTQAGGDIRVHRYAVNFGAPNAVLVPIGDVKPMDVTTFRRYFATDGLQFLFGNDMALDTPEMLNQMLLSSAGAAPYSLSYAMKGAGLGAFTNAAVRESVTGAWMVPGSFGLVAND
jgi:hypothetical protein